MGSSNEQADRRVDCLNNLFIKNVELKIDLPLMPSFFLICALKNAREHGAMVLNAHSVPFSPIASAFLPVTSGMPKHDRINAPGSLQQPKMHALNDIGYYLLTLSNSQNILKPRRRHRVIKVQLRPEGKEK